MIYYIGSNLFSYDNIIDTNLDHCINYCKSKKILGLDIETTRKFKKGLYKDTDKDNYTAGLDPFLSRIIMLQIGDLENQFIIDTRVVDVKDLKEILENKNILKVGHNLKFECMHLKFNYNFNLQNIHDTMICERILYNGEKISYSLENLAKRYLKIKVNITEKIDLFQQEEFEFFNKEQDLDDLEFIEVNKNIRNDFSDWEDRPFTLEQIKYGTDDIIMPLKIYEVQLKGRLIDEELYLPKKAFNLENKIVPILANMYLRGVDVDVKNWLLLYEKNKEKYDFLKNKLDNYIIQNHTKFCNPPNLFTTTNTCGIDWQSPSQVVNFVKYLGCCPKEKSKQTGKIEYTVGAKAVLKILENKYKEMFISNQDCDIVDNQTFLLNFLVLKKYQQLTTTFGKEWIEKYIHPITKKVHCNFIQLMNTGRMSSTSPNMQQIPNGKEWRELFISTSGYKCIATDFAAQEARLASQITGIKAFQQIFNEGHPIFKDDIHSLTATNMFKIIKNDPTFICDKTINKKERNTAKAMLFKLLFGGSDFTVAMDLGLPIEEGKLFYNAFFDGFPGLRENFEETKKLALKRGWIELDNITKSRYFYPHFEEMNNAFKAALSYYPEDFYTYNKEQKEIFKRELYEKHPYVKDYWKTYGILKGKLERAALNYRIQALAARQAKLVMIYLEETNFSLEEGLRLFVHDEAFGIYKTENSEKISKLTVDYMKKSGEVFSPDVISTGVSEIGDYWIH